MTKSKIFQLNLKLKNGFKAEEFIISSRDNLFIIKKIDKNKKKIIVSEKISDFLLSINIIDVSFKGRYSIELQYSQTGLISIFNDEYIDSGIFKLNMGVLKL